MTRIAIVTDSASDLGPERAQELGIHVVPLVVSFGAESFKAGVDITREAFWARMTAPDAPFPTTAASSPGDFQATYEKAFAAGADLREIAGLDAVGAMDRRAWALTKPIAECRKPVIAAVNGFALGGGCELALACTLRTASSKARFGLPEASLGIVPGYGGSQRLSRIAGPGVAREWVLTGDMFGADEAHRVGVVNRVFAPEELEEGTQKLLKRSK